MPPTDERTYRLRFTDADVAVCQFEAMKRDKSRQARERLLAAADRLFYREGVHAVGIDRLVDEPGVAKRLPDAARGRPARLRHHRRARGRARVPRLSLQ